MIPLKLTAKLVEINQQQIKLQLDDREKLGNLADQILVIPKKLLSDDCMIGERFVIELLTQDQSLQTKEQLNRLLLEELLNG